MERKQADRVVDTMNTLERARALQGMHEALLLGNLTLAATSRVRKALRSAGEAMTLVYGAPHR
ncbi:MAG TPA: hypothetical protein VMN79_19585 [Casimicrobiaceae bacterium]|nr:hypothetical protein [Casimicrobiaceae bacterium]